jgi:hypothetical protein
MNNQAQQADSSAKMQQLLAKCWTDEGFKKQMLADPMAVMKVEGVVPPAGLTIKVVENTNDTLYLTIPVKPTSLSDDDLENVSGGGAVKAAFDLFGPEILISHGPIMMPMPNFPTNW